MNNEAKNPETEAEGEFTNIIERFSGILGKFKIKNAEMVADHCAKGNLEELEDVEARMRDMGVHPSLVTQVVNFWADEIQQPVPKRLKEKLNKAVGIKSKTSEEETDRIYYVESDTAIIRLATGSERATSLPEAKELQKIIKRDLEAQRKREEVEGGSKETPFVVGEGGTWTLNPKAKIGFGEFAVFQMYQDSLRKGEPIDPVEELTKREEQSVRLRSAMGVKAGGEDIELTFLDKLDKFGMLKKGEGGEGGLLAQLSALGLLKKSGEEGSTTQIEMLGQLNTLGLLKKPGEGDIASQTVIALQTEVKELRESLQKQEMDTVKNSVVSLINQMTELRKEIASGGQLEGRYALLGTAMNKLDTQLSGIRSDAKPILAAISGGTGGGQTRRSPEDKAKLTRGLKDAVALEQEARALEDDLVFSHGSQG